MSSTLISFLNGWLAELKRDKKKIYGAIRRASRNQRGTLLLKYAETGASMGYIYLQKGNEFFAKCEFKEANDYRQGAAAAQVVGLREKRHES